MLNNFNPIPQSIHFGCLQRKTKIKIGYKSNITPESKYFEKKITNDPIVNHLIKEK
jgi:hypothetical protein